jgi:AcrR family transcriptional regulator
MAWDTEGTRRRLKAAATEEFAAHGLAGATMDNIARRAAINKERLYHYFGGKEHLFAAVLEDELARIAQAVPLRSLREVDLGEFAGLVFDYHAEHPHLARLLHWEGLCWAGPGPGTDQRQRYYQDKIDAFAAAQRDGLVTDEIEAGYLVFLVIGLAAWWFAVPQLAYMLTGGSGDAPEQRARQRDAVVTAARFFSLRKPDGQRS